MLLHNIFGRQWAVTHELAEQAFRLLQVNDAAAIRALLGTPGEQAAGPQATTSRGGTVQLIPVMGLLTHRGGAVNCMPTTSTAAIGATIRGAAADASVGAILLELDSPGGEVNGVAELAAIIREARAQKPVIAIANTIAGSAAYWLAAQADELLVTPSGEVGSIGIYGVHEDRSKADELAGVKRTFIHAGKYKVEGNPAEPLGDEARAARQESVNRYYHAFVGDVAKGRKVSVDAVRNGFGEGRMVGAKAAVDQGMADAVGTLEDAIRRAAFLARRGKAPAAAAATTLAEAQALRIRRERIS